MASKKAVAVKKDEVPMAVGPVLLMAGQAQEGMTYLNWTRKNVWQVSGARRTNDREGVAEVQLIHGRDVRGVEMESTWVPTHYPLVKDDEGVQAVLDAYKANKERFSRSGLSRIDRQRTVEVTDPETGETKRVPKVTRKRGDVDPRTGYATGTDAHAFGEIMLNIGTGLDKKEEVVEAIFKILEPRGKAKAYAKSWYSYLKAKKPEIYAK